MGEAEGRREGEGEGRRERESRLREIDCQDCAVGRQMGAAEGARRWLLGLRLVGVALAGGTCVLIHKDVRRNRVEC